MRSWVIGKCFVYVFLIIQETLVTISLGSRLLAKISLKVNKKKKCHITFYESNNKHLVTGPEGNSEFCFPRISMSYITISLMATVPEVGQFQANTETLMTTVALKLTPLDWIGFLKTVSSDLRRIIFISIIIHKWETNWVSWKSILSTFTWWTLLIKRLNQGKV